MCSKTKTAITLAIVFVVGFVAGALIGIPPMSSKNGAGNISMVSKYHKTTVSPSMSAFQEKLMNDPEALEQAALSLNVISARMAQFNALVDVALDASKDVPELSGYMETLQNMKSVSENAEQSGRDAVNSFDQAFLQKNAAGTDYEQASQKLTLAYLLVDRQMKVAKEYVAALDKVLGNNPESNIKLAAVRDLWANYCAGNAYISDDKDEQGYWEKQNPILTGEQLGAVFTQIDLPPVVVEPIASPHQFNENFDKLVLGFSQDVKAGFSQDVKAGFDQDVKAGFDQDVKAGFSQDVKAGFAQDVKAGFVQDVKAGFGQDIRNGFSQDIKSGFGFEVVAGFSQDVKAGFGQDVRAGFDQDVKAGFEQQRANN